MVTVVMELSKNESNAMMEIPSLAIRAIDTVVSTDQTVEMELLIMEKIVMMGIIVIMIPVVISVRKLSQTLVHLEILPSLFL